MFLKKKILALVPARGGSKGIKFKNLKKIQGVSLIGHSAEFIDRCNFFDEKILSTESKKIAKEANTFGFKIFKRSKFTSKDFTSDFDVISEVLKDKNILRQKYDYVVYLQPTSPLRRTSQLRYALKEVIKRNFDSSWSISQIDNKYHPKKVLKISNENFLTIYNKNGKKIVARQQLDKIYIRNGIFYIFKVSKFVKNKNIYFKRNYPSITKYPYVNIDTYQDLRKIRTMLG